MNLCQNISTRHDTCMRQSSILFSEYHMTSPHQNAPVIDPLVCYICPIGSSGNNLPAASLAFRRSLWLLGIKSRMGGTRSLNKKVPYTKSPNPTTCNHLKLSQPRPRLMIQTKSVRHVSIILRDVADKDLVTLRPKKLNPLMLTIIRTLVIIIILLLNTCLYPVFASK